MDRTVDFLLKKYETKQPGEEWKLETEYENLKQGDPVFVWGEVRPYRVKCRDERYIICTKPFNPKRTVMYFIIDLELGMRGPDNMVFCCGYETQEQCEERLKELQNGQIEVSKRRSVALGKLEYTKP